MRLPDDLVARAQARAWLQQQRASRVRVSDVWRPNPGPQTQAVESPAYELLYGGQAGGGKSWWLVHDALRHIDCPSYRAILFRRSFPELRRTLMANADGPYRRLGGRYIQQTNTWTFPSGAQIMFSYLDNEGDELRYQGAEFQFVGFDELTHFSEKQYLYLFSRLRSAHGVRSRMRATTNPGGPGHEWVLQRWAPWLESEEQRERTRAALVATLDDGDTVMQEVPHAAPGEILHYRKTPQGDVFGEGRLTRQFIPAKLADNPYLAGDLEYVEALDNLDPVTRAQLKEGRWDAMPGAGTMFKGLWFKRARTLPPPDEVLVRVRYWDRAATDTDKADRTAGVRLARLTNKSWVVEDVVVFRGTPAVVEATLRAVAERDAELLDASGRRTVLCLEQDPAAAGKFEASYYVREFAEFAPRIVRPLGSKPERASVPSAQTESGMVALLDAPWRASFVEELAGFPDGTHDDQVDAFSGAMRVAMELTRPRKQGAVKVRMIGRPSSPT